MDKRALVLAALKERHLTISTAESCTGGMIAAALTDLSGSSAVFVGGVVSYWTDVKQKILGVSRETLDCFGAVSPDTAKEMAEGVRKLLGSDLSVSVTGVAGPDRDERGNPVGCVYLALSDGETTTVHHPDNLGSTREEIRANAVAYALDMVLEYVNQL
jgi:nicotinamide-nucleotide amidase